MKIKEIASLLSARVHTGGEYLDRTILFACGADLMSDVMAFVDRDVLLLTGLATPQALRTAELMDIPAVVLVRGKQPDPDMVKLADDGGIILMSTEHSLFVACGVLYEAGIRHGGGR